jgi:hypothetical protein
VDLVTFDVEDVITSSAVSLTDADELPMIPIPSQN